MTQLVSVQRYDHVAKIDLRKKKTLQKTLKFSNCRESIRKQFRPSCREILEIRANIRIAFKMFEQGVA